MLHTIYKHTSKTSKKVYIGKTSISIKNRLEQHFKIANNINVKLTHFHRALLKYGIEDFTSEIIVENVPDYFVNPFEKYWIKYYDTLKNGYNMTEGGDGCSGYKQTKEHTEKIRKANTGLKRTDAQKKNISDAHLGQVAWNKGISTDISHLHYLVTCPYCNKEGNNAQMKQWHFDYCKNNPNKLIRKRKQNE